MTATWPGWTRAIRATELQLKRLRPLLEQGYAKRADVEDLEVTLERSRRERMAVAAAHALDVRLRDGQTRQLTDAMARLDRNHAMAQRTLDDLTVRAPIDGQLTTLDADVGASKTAGQRIGQIDGQDAFKVTALVDEFYVSQVASGQAASVDVDGRSYRLTVVKIHPEIRNRQFSVDLNFAGQTPPAIRRGQTLQLRLEIGSPVEGLMVANGPFLGESDGRSVFVVAPAGDRAERRVVSLGRHNPRSVEVLSGLAVANGLSPRAIPIFAISTPWISATAVRKPKRDRSNDQIGACAKNLQNRRDGNRGAQRRDAGDRTGVSSWRSWGRRAAASRRCSMCWG